jgi:hypothetical protein
VVYTDVLDAMIVIRALQGRSTLAIAREFNISPHKVNYRIYKAQRVFDTSFRGDYRNGIGPLARRMAKATQSVAMGFVRNDLVPHFAPYAAPGIARKI